MPDNVGFVSFQSLIHQGKQKHGHRAEDKIFWPNMRMIMANEIENMDQ